MLALNDGKNRMIFVLKEVYIRVISIAVGVYLGLLIIDAWHMNRLV